jgi:hypothetical protein
MKKAADRGQHAEGVEQIGRGVAMGPKHFQLLSDVIAQNKGQPHEKFVGALADRLAGTNPRFNKGKFKAACGVN